MSAAPVPIDQIDHYAAARSLLRTADKRMSGILASTVEVAAEMDLKAAHVHAMLAVAEQQRIANLIAITDLRRVQPEGNQLIQATETVFDNPTDVHRGYDIKPAIRQGLGL